MSNAFARAFEISAKIIRTFLKWRLGKERTHPHVLEAS